MGCAAGVLDRPLLKRSMGLPNWSFSASWASNITAVTALLSFSLIVSILSEQSRYLSKSQYLVFAALFPLLASLAPVVYVVLTKLVVVVVNNVKSVVNRGWGRTFLVACFFTVWGCLGQLAVQALVIFEIWQLAKFPAEMGWIIDPILGLLTLGVFGFLIVGLMCYAVRSMIRAVQIQPEKPFGTEAKQLATTKLDQLDHKAAIPSWRLL